MGDSDFEERAGWLNAGDGSEDSQGERLEMDGLNFGARLGGRSY